MIISASAPSNIALIKYMGKSDANVNQPTNSSFSYTLESLRSFVEISLSSEQVDEWAPLKRESLQDIEMSETAIARYLKHFSNLKSRWGIKGCYLVRSANNFPGDCGLASSASSFAALTLASARLAEHYGHEALHTVDLAELSRQGSGSSCRSFFGPWVLWSGSSIRPMEMPFGRLQHLVVVASSEKKQVASSQAHQRVLTSPLFEGRPARAEARLAQLLMAFRQEQWSELFNIVWSEFWDMHALFETSRPPFGYFEAATSEILSELRKLWLNSKDGPLVTMDAGANVHLLFREDQGELRQQIKTHWQKRLQVFDEEMVNKA